MNARSLTHDPLIEAVTAEFAAHFVPGGEVMYRGDTGWCAPGRGAGGSPQIPDVDRDFLPDVIIHDPARDGLFLVDAITRHGTVDEKRRGELARLFAGSAVWLEFVSALTTRAQLGLCADGIAWETVVWMADAPEHLIHYNGSRVLGPYRSR